MPVSLVQRGPFSYDEYTNISSSDASTRTFTLDKAKFDPTIGEVLEVFVSGVKLVGDGTFVTGGSNPGTGASAHEFSVNSAKTQLTIVSDSDLATATDSAVQTVGAGNDILIRRVSNRTAKKVDFAPGSVIREADLDNANTQVFHVAQEAIDTALQGMVLDAGSWNAESGGVNRTIKNAATPTSSDPSHYVATKGYVDGTSTTATVSAIANQVTTVAGISTDVTTVAGAVKETVAYTLTASGGKFYIAGGEFSSATSNPVLNLQRGSTYTFDYSDSSISSGSHVLGFSSADTNTNNSGAVAYTGSANGISDNTVDKIITFVVPASAPDTLYYYCTAHNAMGNTMNIAEDSIEIVADNIANVNKVGAIDGNVTKVANIDGDVTKVVALGTDGADVTTVANIGTNGADVTTVAGKATEINTLVNGTDGTSGTSGSTNNLALINTVEGSISNVNTVATNINHVNNFNDTYHTPSGTAPTGSNVTEGDLWYDTANDVLKVYDGSGWGAATSSISTVASTSEFTASDGQGTGNKFFAFTVDAGLEIVWLNGVKLKRDNDYHLVNSNTDTGTGVSKGSAATFIRLETVPSTNDVLAVMGFGQISNNLAVNVSGGAFTGGVTFEAGTTHNTGSNTFTLPTTRGSDNYVLTRDDSVGTGGTAWKETISAPSISSITYPTQNGVQATALAATGAQDTTAETLLINGSDFTSTVTVNISGNGVSSSAFAGTVSVNTAGTVITCSSVTKRASADNYTLTVTNTTGLNTTTTVNFSADPSFTTASGSLGTVYAGTAMSTKTITAGSSVSWYEGTPTMPTWMTHFADGATGTSQDLTGTPTNTGTSEVQNFNIIIRDSENQSHNRDFSLTVADLPTGGSGANGSGSPYTFTGDGTTGTNGVTYRVHEFWYLASGHADASHSGTYHDITFQTYSDLSDVEYLVIAGGGSGGVYSEGPSYSDGNSGNDSLIINSSGTTIVSSTGGGYGAAYNNRTGGSGGSGGGGGGPSGTGGSAVTGGVPNVAQGYSGATATGGGSGSSYYYNAGGGGGAGEAGSTDGNYQGGDGLSSYITGSSVTRAGGGGANDAFRTINGAGGDGGGGRGTYGGNNSSGLQGTDGTGSGGGAGDAGIGAGHGGGGAGGYKSAVYAGSTGETSGGGTSANSKLSLPAGTYTMRIGAGGARVGSTGGTWNAYSGRGGHGIIIIRYAI